MIADERVDVAVIGAGAVGLACAYEFSLRDASVWIGDAGKIGGAATRGNTGWVTPSLTRPMPAPGVMRQALGSMARGGGPLTVRASLDPSYLGWLWRFARSCSAAQFARGMEALNTLNRVTFELFDEYRDRGVQFEMHESGLVVAARTAEGLAPFTQVFAGLRATGYEAEIDRLSASELVALEPSLDPSRVVGGFHTRVERYVRPESLANGLAAELTRRGVSVSEHSAVQTIRRSGDDFELHLPSRRIAATRVVVATGVSSGQLLGQLGIRVPIIGGKGHSVTLRGTESSPSHALYLSEAKLGISAYDGATRIAGQFELGATDTRVDRRQIEALLDDADGYFQDWRPSSVRREEEWAGLRPMTADGLPIIGPVEGIDNLFIAAGHGMLGVTLAPATGRLLARLLFDGNTPLELRLLATAQR